MHVRTVENPIAVADSEKDVASLFLMRLRTSRFAPPRIPCVASKPARLQSLLLDKITRFLEPVATKIRLARDTIAVSPAQFFHVRRAHLFSHQFVSEKWRITDDHIALRPLAFGIKFERVIARVFAGLRFLQ